MADLLRGPRGTQVRVTVKREGAPDFISAEVTRGEIETSIVDAFWVKPGVRLSAAWTASKRRT